MFEYCDGNDQIKLKKLYYNGCLEITDLYNVANNIKHNLCDNDLKYFKKLKKLDASCSNEKITDDGIRNMNLHTLDASFNSKITDDGIKNMNLHTLNARKNSKITDEGIKNMNLRTLNARGNSKITDEGIKNMNLHTLYARYN